MTDHLPMRQATPARLRIMQLILSRGFAGSERAVVEACNGMCASHDVALVVRRGHRGRGRASILDHVNPSVSVFELPAYWRTRRRLEQTIGAWQPDVIHTHLRRGTRYVAQIGAGPVHVSTLHIALNGPHYLRADGLMCISEWQVGTVPADYPGRVYLLPNSLEPQPRLTPERIRELRSELGASDGDYLIGAVGRLSPSKGFDVLVSAFESARLPHGRLVIVGDGSERRRLRRLAGERVSLVGFRRDVKDLYQAFDLFVSPSRIEPFGRVIIEALDGGVPVIATDAQGPRDIARRYPIEIVPRDDVDALAGALAKEAGRPRRRLNVDLSEFHAEHIVGRMISAYRELIAAQEPRV